MASVLDVAQEVLECLIRHVRPDAREVIGLRAAVGRCAFQIDTVAVDDAEDLGDFIVRDRGNLLGKLLSGNGHGGVSLITASRVLKVPPHSSPPPCGGGG